MVPENTYTLTQSQLLLWAGYKINPQSPSYNMAFVYELTGEVNSAHFRKAFQELVDRNDALRTVFKEEGGLPKQIILPQLPYSLEILQMGSEEELHKWKKQRCQEILRLEACCFDSVLVQIGPGHYFWYFNLHHLITDVWSSKLLFQDMGDLYTHISQSTAESPAPLPSFQEFIPYEHDSRFNAKNEASRLFWEEKAGELPVPPRLYGEKGDPTISHSERILLDLGLERSNALRKLSQEKDFKAWTEDMALFNVFSTVLFVYLYRVSGQKNLTLGTPSHNRPSKAFKQTPGVFIELYPLLAQLEGTESFTEVFYQVRTEATDFLRNAKPGTSSFRLSRQFNVVLNYIHTKFPEKFAHIPMKGEWLHPNHCDPGHHLRLQVHDFQNTGNIQLNFDLNTSVFDEEKRGLVPAHFLTILDAFLEDHTQGIGGFALEDQPIPLPIFPDPEKRVSTDESVLARIQKSVQIQGASIALQQGDSSWTYQKLWDRSSEIAAQLLEMGVHPGDRVGLFMRRDKEFIAAIIGVWKAGATYIPLPSDTPKERLNFILEDAACKALLSESSLSDVFNELTIPTKLLDTIPVNLNGNGTHRNIPEDQELADLAYIMYTSGSTGTPKGVMVPQKALSNYIQWAASAYQLDEPFIFPLFSKIGFDLTVTSQFVPLISGGSLVIYPENGSGTDLSILDVIEDNQVNTLKLTPSHLNLLKDYELHTSKVQTLIVGGEDFPTTLAREVSEKMGNLTRIFNEYGPTEATVGCIVHQFDPKIDNQVSVPIGLPITHMEGYVLDTHHNPVPKGVPGELYLGGVGIAKGYVNQPVLTDSAFISIHGLSPESVYKTGDLVRINTQNQMEYLGRVDKQVKIGGVRIEPGEIESLLAKHPAIQMAVVEVQKNPIQHAAQDIHYCVSCGLPSNYPDAVYDEEGVCNLCNSFESYQRQAQQYFRGTEELRALFNEIKSSQESTYDCLVLLSGGKDSSYALARLVEMDLKVLAFTLDNGYISEQAKANIKRVVNTLEVDHIFGETSAMNAIFVDSLKRHSNVCNGCFKTIYTLSTKIALEKGIPYIVTGLSRGQFFETRLTEELFREKDVDVSKIDQTILEARKAYHKVNDAVCQLLDVSMFADDEVFEKVKFVDFYRYTDVSLEEMMTYLEEKLPWKRPTDTGRSTNCLINQVGIYIHKKERGYNNYAFPYSWDVRIGHKTRDEALYEINEPIEEKEVRKILEEIGYSEVLEKFTTQKSLTAFYTTTTSIDPEELKTYLAEHLPTAMIPTRMIALEEIPLTANGKIDRESLRTWGVEAEDAQLESLEDPETEIEELVTPIWAEILKLDRIGTNQDFIALGGTSLSAIRIMARINESLGMELPLVSIFENSTIAALSTHIEDRILELMDAE